MAGSTLASPTTEGNKPAVTSSNHSPGREAWRRFKRHKLAVVCSVVLGFIVLAVLLGPWVWRVPINEIDFNARMQGPSWAHPLGTEDEPAALFVPVSPEER
jgi:peptide/nickel transport system permease protein